MGCYFFVNLIDISFICSFIGADWGWSGSIPLSVVGDYAVSIPFLLAPSSPPTSPVHTPPSSPIPSPPTSPRGGGETVTPVKFQNEELEGDGEGDGGVVEGEEEEERKEDGARSILVHVEVKVVRHQVSCSHSKSR